MKIKEITLRDYFAAKAMQALIFYRSEVSQGGTVLGTANPLKKSVSSWAYSYADAMLKEREK